MIVTIFDILLFEQAGVIILNNRIFHRRDSPRLRMHLVFSNAPFLQAMVAGLALAAPVGPVGLLCIKRTLARGMLTGFLSGIGAAVADALYASVAAYGITVISSTLHRFSSVIEIVGGTLLCIIGLYCIYNHKAPAREVTAGNMVQTFLSTLAITLTNPATIIGFAALFSAMGLAGEEGTRRGALILVGGVFAGSALWWLILSTGMHFVRHLLSERAMHRINLIAGSILVIFGIVVISIWIVSCCR